MVHLSHMAEMCTKSWGPSHYTHFFACQHCESEFVHSPIASCSKHKASASRLFKVLHIHHSNKFPLRSCYSRELLYYWINCHVLLKYTAASLMTRSYFKPFSPLMHSILNSAVNPSFQTTLLNVLRLLLRCSK